MTYDYDIMTIGLGPAGMAVAAMGSALGLNVCAIERRKVGGECLNVGCIPSKALLRIARMRHATAMFPEMALQAMPNPALKNPFDKIARDLHYISEHKTMGIFKKVDVRMGTASFVNAHTVEVNGEQLSAKRIFIATGTRPRMPSIPGIEAVDVLTNNTVFDQARVPESMVIVGGGAIGCEMAQAFSRLGCTCTIVNAAPHLVAVGDPEASLLLEESFAEEGIVVLNDAQVERVEKTDAGVLVHTGRGEKIFGERLLMAAGREIDLADLQLENAGVRTTSRGAIQVDKYLRTSQSHIFAVGDCNGHWLFSHAAMHQGSIALMNSMLPWPMKRNFMDYAVPWSVFTDPQVSYVGMREADLKEKGIVYETTRVDFGDYGAAIAENVPKGFIKVFSGRRGKIYGVSIVGEGSGEMINEWSLAIQKNIRLHDIMLLQHAFPTMGFLSKRVAEVWMMKKMGSSTVQKIAQWLFRH